MITQLLNAFFEQRARRLRIEAALTTFARSKTLNLVKHDEKKLLISTLLGIILTAVFAMTAAVPEAARLLRLTAHSAARCTATNAAKRH